MDPYKNKNNQFKALMDKNYLDKIKIKADDKKVYLPREDSYLLAKALEEHLKQNKYNLVIDVGCGSGILSILAAKYQDKIIALDISEEALSQAKKNARLNHENKILFFKSDLLEKFRIIPKNSLIIFNPPYLPSQKIKYIDLDGGKQGREIILRFFDEIAIKNAEKALILVSSLNDFDYLKNYLKIRKFDTKVLASQKFDFEELQAWLVEKAY